MFFVSIPRKIAKERGLKTYFSSSPCKFNGVGWRLVSNGACNCETCSENRKNTVKKYLEVNSEIIKEKQRIYNQKPERKLKKSLHSKEWRRKNPELAKEIVKKCYEQNGDTYKQNRSKRDKEMRKINPEPFLIRERRYKAKNRVILNLSNIEYRKKIRHDPKKLERLREWRREYSRKNSSKYIAKSIRRRIRKSQANVWNTELDAFVHTESICLSRIREQVTGFKWHTDHMIPLQNPDVCGLHVWNNFQCLPQVMNNSKSNKLIYTNPHEWLYDIPKFFKVVYQQEIAA